MTAVSAKWGLAVLVTAVLLVSTLGLAGVGAASRPSAGTASPTTVASPSVHGGPTAPTATAAPSGTQALLTSKGSSTLAAPPTPSGRTASLVNDLETEHVPLKDAFLPDLNANPHP